MSRVALALTTLLAVALAASTPSCARPLHARTFIMSAPSGTHWDHPAVVPSGALDLALIGRVAAADIPGLATTMAHAFASLAPDQVLYYRHPDGGAYLFAVRAHKLIVTPLGLRRGAVAEYDLADLAAADHPSAPPKHAILSDPVAAADPSAAELEVEAAFAIEQFIFVDGTFLGTVPPGETRTFAVHPGAAIVVAADAKDGSNPARLSLRFTTGQRVHLSIEPDL